MAKQTKPKTEPESTPAPLPEPAAAPQEPMVNWGTRADAMRVFGISEPTLRRWRKEKYIEAIRLGKDPVWETVKNGKVVEQKFHGAGHWRYNISAMLAKLRMRLEAQK